MLSNYENVAETCQSNFVSNAGSLSINGHNHPEIVGSSELEIIDDETETLEQLYEQLKDHPLAGLIGTYHETDDNSDINDASMNVHKYLAEYHAEQHANRSH